MRKKFLIPVILISCALMMSACGSEENTTSQNTTPSVEETVEVEETEETAPVVEETTPVETEEVETEEVEETTPTTTPEATTPSNGDNKPSTEETKPSTEETKPQPVEPVHTHNYINGDCSCGAHDPNYQPPHTHNYTGGDCTHPSTCSCGATGNYGSHNWTTRTWTEQVIHPGETVTETIMVPGAQCNCGYTGTADDVRAHIANSNDIWCSGWCGWEIPQTVTHTTDPWTENINHSETTCSICGARQ